MKDLGVKVRISLIGLLACSIFTSSNQIYLIIIILIIEFI